VILNDLQRELREFADEREWQPFHTPKNLVMALSGEVGELTELFQGTNRQVRPAQHPGCRHVAGCGTTPDTRQPRRAYDHTIR
jgi:NTP pyrophosphatase (non-canonical NTP hydrolase)